MIDSDGLLGYKGKYDNVDFVESVKYTKLLPEGEYYTKLIINDYHSKLLHLRVSQTLVHTWKEYWILHGRSQVKKILNLCRVCCCTEGNPFRCPECLLGQKRESTKPYALNILDLITLDLCTLSSILMFQI